MIESVVQTCTSCPAQWEVTLSDGRGLYVRYRWGMFSVASIEDLDPFYQVSLGDGLDGEMSTDEMLSHLTLALS